MTVAGALSKLYLTDLHRLMPVAVDHTESKDGDNGAIRWRPLSGTETAYARMISNVERLARMGAVTDNGLPFDQVTGFPITKKDRINMPGVRTPKEVIGATGGKVKLLMWGSPHPQPSSAVGASHGMKSKCEKGKTGAFEAMSWACDGTSIMTFSAKYNVEFLQPQHCYFEETPRNRLLMVGRMHAEEYVPMASGNGLRYTVPDADIGDTMIAMLVAPEHLPYLVFNCNGGKIHFGQTCASIIAVLKDDEFAVALGVYDLSLEMEIYLAFARRTLEEAQQGASRLVGVPESQDGENDEMST